MTDFSRFDELVDLDALRDEVEKVSNGSGDFEEVPYDTYEVAIEKMLLKESKSGKPMLSVWWRIVAGDFEGQMLFQNQVIEKPFQIHVSNQLLRSLKTGIEIDFQSYSQYARLVDEVREEAQKREYALEYVEKRGYKVFTIVEVYQ